MKKILSFIMGLILLSSVLAGPPMPQPFVVYLSFEGNPVVGLDVTFTCASETIVETTNNLGGVMIELNNIASCPILTVSCGYDACANQYNTANFDNPVKVYYELGEAPPEPEPECIIDSDCSTDYVCTNEECVYVEPEPEPEPKVEDKVTSNADNTIALIESNYGECVDVVVTDNKLSNLIDDVIDFDTEDYDVHEEIRVKYCLETSIDDSDYGLGPVIVIEEGEIEYRYVFDDILPLAEIEDDEELEITFLGEDIEIISLSTSKMTIRHGEIFLNLKEQEEIMYDGLPLIIGIIDSNFVYVTYNGDSEKIYEDETGEVGGIQVFVDEAVPNEDGDDLASLRIAEDIEEVIEDGDEYNEDYDYVIQDGYIGITNSKEFKYLDEENKPLRLGDKIELPNGVIIKFNEITNSDVTEIDIRVRDSYLNVNGDKEDSFTFNNQDYDELYVDDTGIYDEDKVLISNKVRIGESDVYLEKGSIIIGDLVIELDFLDILYKGISFANKDESYLTHEGIIFKNPEDSVNGHSTFDIIVPDEVPEVKVTIGAESETIGLPVEPKVCPEPTEEECEDTICEPIKACDVCNPCEECPPVEPVDCPKTDGTGLSTTIILALVGVLIGGGGMYYFKKGETNVKGTGVKIYVNRKGERTRQHKHPGIRGYHNPLSMHRVAKERHPKGELDPEYQKDDKGEWKYVG